MTPLVKPALLADLRIPSRCKVLPPGPARQTGRIFPAPLPRQAHPAGAPRPGPSRCEWSIRRALASSPCRLQCVSAAPPS